MMHTINSMRCIIATGFSGNMIVRIGLMKIRGILLIIAPGKKPRNEPFDEHRTC